MKDQLQIVTAFDNTVRIYAALTAGVVETARHLHDTWPTATAALGRTLTATLIMGVMHDDIRRLTVRVAGDGPLGGIVAVSNRRGAVKGYVNHPQVNLDLNSLGKLDVGTAVGNGYLYITKDIGLKEPYQGVVPLQSGEIGEDFAYYFTKSEQTPSAVALGVLVAPDGHVLTAGGLIIQMMPGAEDSTAIFIEERLSQLPPLTTLLEQGMTPLQLIQKVIGEDTPLKLLDGVDVCYECDCSKERFLGPLLTLEADEVQEMLATKGAVEVRCHFCNRLYHYDQHDLETGEGSHA
ncbi:MAG TPA: Hsp33 family molecular chaperone HslO [Bacillota bacterium]|nr:Hsp33 family molecular chaperone HslO [Bacillota bacterium]